MPIEVFDISSSLRTDVSEESFLLSVTRHVHTVCRVHLPTNRGSLK